MVSKIPKYFAVFNDGTPEWSLYIKWLNDTYKYCYMGTDCDTYYGYDGGQHWNGTFVYNKHHIKEDVVIFESASDFLKLLNLTIVPKIHELW